MYMSITLHVNNTESSDESYIKDAAKTIKSLINIINEDNSKEIMDRIIKMLSATRNLIDHLDKETTTYITAYQYRSLSINNIISSELSKKDDILQQIKLISTVPGITWILDQKIIKNLIKIQWLKGRIEYMLSIMNEELILKLWYKFINNIKTLSIKGSLLVNSELDLLRITGINIQNYEKLDSDDELVNYINEVKWIKTSSKDEITQSTNNKCSDILDEWIIEKNAKYIRSLVNRESSNISKETILEILKLFSLTPEVTNYLDPKTIAFIREQQLISINEVFKNKKIQKQEIIKCVELITLIPGIVDHLDQNILDILNNRKHIVTRINQMLDYMSKELILKLWFKFINNIKSASVQSKLSKKSEEKLFKLISINIQKYKMLASDEEFVSYINNEEIEKTKLSKLSKKPVKNYYKPVLTKPTKETVEKTNVDLLKIISNFNKFPTNEN